MRIRIAFSCGFYRELQYRDTQFLKIEWSIFR